MVDQEAVRLARRLAVLPERGADRFRLLPGVCEHKTLVAARVLEDVCEPRISVYGSGIGGGLLRRLLRVGERPFRCDVLHALIWGGNVLLPGKPHRDLVSGRLRVLRGVAPEDVGPAFGRLGTRRVEVLHGSRRVEVLHGYAPALLWALELWDDAAASGAGAQVPSGPNGIANGGGEPYASGIHAGEPAQPLDAAEALVSAVPAQQRVDLVYHDVAKVAEDAPYG